MNKNTYKNNDFQPLKPLFYTFFGPSLSNYWKDIHENRAVYPYNASDVSGIIGALT